MTEKNVLYFLANRELYRYGKINLLSAQSALLHSRERIKKLTRLKESEYNVKKSIVSRVSEIRKDIQKFHQSLPKTRKYLPESLQPRDSMRKQRGIQKKPRYKDHIKQELSDIEDKLRELQSTSY